MLPPLSVIMLIEAVIWCWPLTASPVNAIFPHCFYFLPVKFYFLRIFSTSACSQTPSLHALRRVTEQVVCPYKATHEFKIMYVLSLFVCMYFACLFDCAYFIIGCR